ncbi:MAG: biopolymer transporter ExbD [Prevotella sp.]|nr:biopolymer transporter ExbD [Prevotella sp.]
MRNRYFSRNAEERDVPGLNMASLPDLIFTVLFFFMIVTHMRDVDLKVHYEVPQGSEVQKLDHKASVVHIYVGRATGENGKERDGFLIQLNDQVATVDDISAFLEKERARMTSEDLSRMTVSIKADRDVPMGVISDIKRALQQDYALRINYSATEKETQLTKQ